MTENTKQEKKYSFIKNQPLGEDLFKNKSQEKTAIVISEAIINDPDFKIIGIDGEWGSGKSNLVRLIENKLENTHKFFVYDVWGHQEDEQRHSILSELTGFITQKNIIKGSSDWKEKLVTLTSKQKNTTTTNIPHLSIGFILSLLLIIYVPTVNTFAKEIDSWWIKIPIVLLPIVLLLGLFIKFYLKISNVGKKENHYSLKKWKRFKKYSQEAAQELFKVYHNQKKAETKIEVISEKEPNVKEFRSWMKQIDEDLKQKVVIVLDNFDRLPKKHIQSIWSSVHIFFAEEHYANIKVIIPFDRAHVQNAFNDLNGSPSDEIKFGNDYVNKTFDIVFRVTKPIMSNWKEFFEGQWRKAFLNPDEEELGLVIQVYEFLNRRITPREIISFINEILTIKLLDDQFKERYIAIFVLKKDNILKDPLKAITNFNDLLGGLFNVYSNDPEYAKQLTAIIYHLKVDESLELIYTQELKDSMLKNDVEHFNEICNSDFINSIFYSTMLQIETFENPVLTLDSINKNSNVSMQIIRHTWDLFNNKIIRLPITINKFEIRNWQLKLIKNVENNSYLINLLDHYFSLIDDANIENYIDLIDNLITDLTEKKVLTALNKRIISEKNFIKIIEYCGKDYKKYNLETDFELLDNYLSKLNVDGILEIENTKFLPSEYSFKNYNLALKECLKLTINQNNITSSNDILVKIKERLTKSEDLKDLLTVEEIYSLYTNNVNSELPILNDLIAMRIAKGSNFSSSYSNKFTTVLNNEDEKRVNEISDTILKYIGYGDLLLLSKTFKESILYKQIILKMFNKTDLGKIVDIITLVEKYEEIKESLEIQDNSLLTELNKFPLDRTKLDINKIDAVFIDDCLNSLNLEISINFLEVFNEGFKNLEKEGYETLFDSSTNIYFKYFQLLNLESLTQTSLDVFENKLITKLKSGKISDSQIWNILSIYDSNNANISVVNSFKNILDEILISKIEFKIEFAKKLLPYFIKYDLLNKENDVFRVIIRNEFLSDSDFIKLLISNSEYIRNIYKNAIQSDKDGFKNLINEKREDNPEFESLAKSLDIKKPK